MKELKIEVPKGYEIDKENSSFECIKFRKKKEIKTWDDLCKHGSSKNGGFFIRAYGNIDPIDIDGRLSNSERSVFLTEKEAKSARAAAMISQLMPYYGGAITDAEWEDSGVQKFVIFRRWNRVVFDVTYTFYRYLAFHTEEQIDSFYKNNEQLVRDYLMLD